MNESESAVIWVFRLVVLAELAAVALLWALKIAALGALAFVLFWAAVLIPGQWFQYWYGSHSQHTYLLARSGAWPHS